MKHEGRKVEDIGSGGGRRVGEIGREEEEEGGRDEEEERPCALYFIVQ